MDWRGLLFGSQGDENRNKWEDADYIRQQVQRGITDARGRAAPQAGNTAISPLTQIDQSRSDQFRGQELGLASALQRQASGQQQGAGELAVQRQAQRAMSNAAGAASMARGNSSVGGARAAARAAGAIGLGAAGQAQQAALGDQAAARQQLAGVLGQGRAQDTSVAAQNMAAENQRAQQQAQLNQSTTLANMQARLQSMGMNDAAIQQYLQQLGMMNAGQQQARSGDNGIIGGLLSGAGQIGAAALMPAACDERLKTNVSDARADIDELLDQLAPFKYEYKEPREHGQGMRVGIMAQHLQRSAAGENLIVDIDEHLAIDPRRAIPTLLAAVARLNERIRELELEQIRKAA